MEYLKLNNLPYTTYAYIAAASYGFVEMSKSLNLPLIKKDFNLSYSTHGLINSTTGWTYMLATMISTGILPLAKFRKLIIISFIMATIGCFISFLFHNLVTILLGLHIMYFGYGILEVGLNCYASNYFDKNSGLMINLFHGAYGIGCVICPSIAGYIGETKLSYRLFYLIASILFFVTTFFAFFLNFDKYFKSGSGQQNSNHSDAKDELIQDDNIDKNQIYIVTEDNTKQNSQRLSNNISNREEINCTKLSITENRDSKCSLDKDESLYNNKNSEVNTDQHDSEINENGREGSMIMDNCGNRSTVVDPKKQLPTSIVGKFDIFLTLLKDPIIIVLIVSLGIQVNVEMAAAQWGALYLQDELGLDQTKDGSFFMTIFYIIFAVSRLISGKFTEKIGYLNTLFISIIGGIIFFTIGFLTGMVGQYFLMFTGCFVSLYWPAVMCLIIEIYGKESSNATAIVISIHGLLGSLLGLLQGVINDNIGPSWGYRSSIVLSILVFFLLIVIFFLKKNRMNRINKNVDNDYNRNKDEENPIMLSGVHLQIQIVTPAINDEQTKSDITSQNSMYSRNIDDNNLSKDITI